MSAADCEENKDCPSPHSSSFSSCCAENDLSLKAKAACHDEGSELYIVIRLFNKSSASSTLQIKRKVLIHMSDFFRSLVENLPDGTTEIALEEDEIYKAVSILSEVADLYSKIKPLPPVVA